MLLSCDIYVFQNHLPFLSKSEVAVESLTCAIVVFDVIVKRSLDGLHHNQTQAWAVSSKDRKDT